MYQLTNLTNKAKQTTKWINGDVEVDLYFEYRPNQLGWYLGIKYKDLIDYRNIRITNNFNLLRSYTSIMPFGLMCITEDNEEPLGIEDFASGYATIYMLTREECKQVEDDFYA